MAEFGETVNTGEQFLNENLKKQLLTSLSGQDEKQVITRREKKLAAKKAAYARRQRRRRRTQSPSSLRRVSETAVSAAPQNGHYIRFFSHKPEIWRTAQPHRHAPARPRLHPRARRAHRRSDVPPARPRFR